MEPSGHVNTQSMGVSIISQQVVPIIPHAPNKKRHPIPYSDKFLALQNPFSISPAFWGVMANITHMKIYNKSRGHCFPGNHYVIEVGTSSEEFRDIMKIDEVSDFYTRFFCQPFHPMKLEARLIGDPNVLFTIIRKDGQFLDCFMKPISCCKIASCCYDEIMIYPGGLTNHPSNIGRPWNLPSNDQLIGRSYQEFGAGWYFPEFLLEEGATNTHHHHHNSTSSHSTSSASNINSHHGHGGKNHFGTHQGSCCFESCFEGKFLFEVIHHFATSKGTVPIIAPTVISSSPTIMTGENNNTVQINTQVSSAASYTSTFANNKIKHLDRTTLAYKDATHSYIVSFQSETTTSQKLIILSSQLLMDYLIFDPSRKDCLIPCCHCFLIGKYCGCCYCLACRCEGGNAHTKRKRRQQAAAAALRKKQEGEDSSTTYDNRVEIEEEPEEYEVQSWFDWIFANSF